MTPPAALLPTLRFLLVGLVLALVACGDRDGPFHPYTSGGGDGEAGIRMGAGIFVLDAEGPGWYGVLTYSITNVTRRTISLPNCNGGFPLRLERWSGKEWKRAWSPALNDCASPPIVIEPGEDRALQLGVFGAHPDTPSWSPRFESMPIDGIHRLVVTRAFWDGTGYGPSPGDPVPVEHLTSRAFWIVTRGE